MDARGGWDVHEAVPLHLQPPVLVQSPALEQQTRPALQVDANPTKRERGGEGVVEEWEGGEEEVVDERGS